MTNWAKRESNRLYGMHKLKIMGIDFQSFNDGAHLRIMRFGHRIDFWPGTGLWKDDGTEGRGIENLLAHIRSINTVVAPAVVEEGRANYLTCPCCQTKIEFTFMAATGGERKQ